MRERGPSHEISAPRSRLVPSQRLTRVARGRAAPNRRFEADSSMLRVLWMRSQHQRGRPGVDPPGAARQRGPGLTEQVDHFVRILKALWSRRARNKRPDAVVTRAGPW